ncbi:cupin domain-containing protein [Bacillus sp. ISL-46]|uniref:cupin domain-containing protein n=1 Tax=Bacillus sp. ISL-46 TaxID=2819129 RepID=UPI001BE6A897|nr:cupin domain-containing protein [Bacillus sp. ISL-46]MBT2723309.1 cupin domain-containing protein [Bacillus sp. ISL-46]
MKKMSVIKNEQVTRALESSMRQYLVGKLSRPQELEYIEDEKLEIGITSYAEFTTELPHYHTQAYEYQYILSGSAEYMDVETGKLYTFEKGDFYVTPPGLTYAQRSQPGTAIFFVKTPPGNDKREVEATDEIKKWLNNE